MMLATLVLSTNVPPPDDESFFDSRDNADL
jgi:hypothetical protein